MADVPVGNVPAPAAPAAPQPSPQAAKVAARQAKIAAANAHIASGKLASEQPSPGAEPAKTEKPAASVAAATEATPTASPDSKPAEPSTTEAAPAKTEPAEDKPDPKIAKGLEAIDKAKAKARAELEEARKQWQTERDLQMAELANLRKELQAKGASVEELRKLAKQNPLDVLERLGFESEDDYALVGRAAYTRTREGKADPKSQASLQQTAKERAQASEIEALKRELEEFRNEFKTDKQQAQTRAFIERYLDEAVKAIPAEPTLIGTLHKKSPEKARQKLLELGQRMERENDGTTPSHAEVIAEYERIRREELEEQGVDVDALLKPAAAKKPADPPPRAPLNIDEPARGTRPINGAPSRAEKLAAINAGLKRLNSGLDA